MRAAALTLAVGLVAASAVPAAPADGDEGVASLQADTVDGREGGGLAVDLVRRVGPDRRIVFGAAGFKLLDRRWAYLHGAFARPVALGTLVLEGRLGGGQRTGAGFRYIDLGGAIGRRVAGPVHGEAGLRWLDVDGLHGVLARGAATAAGRSGSVQMTADASIGGTVATRLLGLRGERRGTRRRVLAGAVVGRATPRAIGLGASPAAVATREAFGGVALPLRRNELLATVGRQRAGSVVRWTAVLTLRWPR